MTGAARLVTALALAGAAACSSSKRSNDQAAATGDAIELTAPGAAPQRPLRHRFAAGTSARLDLRIDIDLTVTVNGHDMPITTLPGLSMRMNVEIVEVHGDGGARWKASLSEMTVVETPGVSPDSAAQLRDALGTTAGLSATGVMTAGGALAELTIERPAAVDPEVGPYLDAVDQLLRQMACPLPGAAIGRGATWEVRSQLDNQGVKIDQQVTNRLTAADGDRVELAQTVKQDAARQTVTDPSSGTSTEVTSLNGTGTASVVLDLTRPWPATYSLEFHLDTAMSSTTQDIEVKMTMLAQATTVP